MSSGRRARATGKVDKEWAGRGLAAGWWALTGTPGTGKSSAAGRLPDSILPLELRSLAAGAGALSGPARSREVDLERLGRYVATHRPSAPVLIVGHLAHRLPVRRTIVLRCHPRELDRRLAARPPSEGDRRENVVAEAIDLIATDVAGRGQDRIEVDTTRRGPVATARRIADRILRGAERTDAVDWLADPTVPPLLRAGLA